MCRFRPGIPPFLLLFLATSRRRTGQQVWSMRRFLVATAATLALALGGCASSSRPLQFVGGDDFEEAALATVRSWRFRPQVEGGQAVAALNRISEIRFRLGDDGRHARLPSPKR